MPGEASRRASLLGELTGDGALHAFCRRPRARKPRRRR